MLDPAAIEGRDETTVARALFATPLTTDARSAALRPGLCRSWRALEGGREWRFRCRSARAIAAALRRVARSPSSPSRWLFASASRIAAPNAGLLVVRLRHAWRRFPYALTSPAAAPRGVAGPFRLVSFSNRKIVAQRRGLTLVFRRLGPYAGLRGFLRGELDEAPVPPGDLGAVRADPTLRGRVRVRPLLALDLVGFQLSTGPLAERPLLRRVYRRTAGRDDYEALITEYAARAAYSLLPRSKSRGRAAPAHVVRQARELVPRLPGVRVRIAVEPDPSLVYAATQLLAHWRDVGLGPELQPLRRFRLRLVSGSLDAWFRRLVAPYPDDEALLAAVLLPRDGQSPWGRGRSRARQLLLRALAKSERETLLEAADEELEATAAVVPIAWVADARLVSPRLRGWRRDALGAVDYTKVLQ